MYAMYIACLAYKGRSGGQRTVAHETTGHFGALKGKQHKNKPCPTAVYNEEKHIKDQQEADGADRAVFLYQLLLMFDKIEQPFHKTFYFLDFPHN